MAEYKNSLSKNTIPTNLEIKSLLQAFQSGKLDIAEKLATGELSAADYKASQSKKPVETEELAISNAGYNVELIDKTKKEVKEPPFVRLFSY